MKTKPTILDQKIVAESRLFRIEQMALRFSNGAERVYERLAPRGTGHQAVMVIPLINDNEVVLVQEYAAGTNQYEWSLPKGLVEPGEDILVGANRELQEEAGLAAQQLKELTEFSLSPNYMSHKMKVVLAEDLYPSRLPGDEPELLDTCRLPLDQLYEWAIRADFTEARAIAALFYLKEFLTKR
ncbi:ADP compounds hydrolase NudE [Spartinivicinus poritis]|uniref:ADP compounds hydrolase NudE n=1 Tax=Spartinivicinus poritis TaxID=2994640 RepID=A0ABT5UBH1_9GAMM|nr:ADP compounds hydrolase NudE [Spartinivicinus sp. A2-2]MDE1462464.1 ADP compounds hydrolase NudE [Spartinivicinus sp. A2-2]